MPDTQITDEMVRVAMLAENAECDPSERGPTRHSMRAALQAALSGHVVVPREPTREMLSAAIDVDSFKLGDISPLGFRESPQKLFERCYRAMIQAAPPVPVERG